MQPDVIDLRRYYASAPGDRARRKILARLKDLWPDTTGQRVLGFGYATPFLPAIADGAERVMAFMPGRQGVEHWGPDGSGGRNHVALTEEAALPLPDSAVDRILIVHGLENARRLDAMLREAWRVLAPQGRIILVVPNRRGLWARFDKTPFGHGRPYSEHQLTSLLRDSRFSPVGWRGALFMPPVSGFLGRFSPMVEAMGRRWWPRFAGVILVEATKQVYAPSANAERAKRTTRRPVLVPLPVPTGTRTARKTD